jgi:hypothetical protein
MIKAKNPDAFNELINEAKTACMQLMQGIVETVPQTTAETYAKISGSGNMVALEMSLNEHKRWSMLLTAVLPNGTRHVLATIAVGGVSDNVGAV